MKSRIHAPSNPRGWTDEGLCAGLSLLGSVAIFEVLDKPAPVASLVALLLSAAVGFGAGWWMVRSRHPKRAVAVSAVVLVAVIVEAAVPTTWHHLLVDPTTWHRVASSLRVGADRTLLAACVLVSLAGASERVAYGDRDRPGTVAHPALAVSPRSSWSRGQPWRRQVWCQVSFVPASSSSGVWPCLSGIGRGTIRVLIAMGLLTC